MGKKKSTSKDSKDGKKSIKPEKIRLLEGTAAKNCNTQKGDDTTAIYIKKTNLQYELDLKRLQIELMKLQDSMKDNGQRILAIFEGRDAAGKGGTIKRITAHLNPRNTRVVALMKPNETEMTQWYFQRYVAHLPSAGEIVIFDRSWYNRAMVEPVMGFCSDEQNKRFLKDVPMFEEMLVKEGIKLFKFYFSVSKNTQKERFDSRKTDPLKQYKLSPVDNLAQEYWDQYSVRKFQMLSETNRTISPWTVIRSDDKKTARLNCMKFILSKMDYDDKLPAGELEPDPNIIISGIDELKHMEDNLMTPELLHG
ncbi:polyphosphate kinase 2 [Desulfopila sp. IMCC35006]|uniref:polyphosphate kinase 2 n=1 Tax=Desulfopila sp. IMCC35006 TaxID=2569542 RepID=UPI0010AC6723|nr:polyphosphate kinase 2 [Desulfopila sp. IMCC35006]TKB25914.1 polyphosphate kinase 2 [Desulfopila sp. IMCC35006]